MQWTGVTGVYRPPEGPCAGEPAHDIARSDRVGQVLVEVPQHVSNVSLIDNQFSIRRDLFIRSSNQQPSTPGDSKENASIFCFRNEQGVIGRK